MTSMHRKPRIATRILDSVAELRTYSDRFVANGGNPISLDYLRQSQVRGFYRDGELVGGFVLNRLPPFRYADWVPEPTRTELVREGYFDARDSVEVSCFWMARNGLQKIQRNGVYVRLVIDAFRTGCRKIIGGSVIPAAARIQKQALPRRLYLGPTTVGPIGEVYTANRWEMLRNLIAAAARTYSADLFGSARKVHARRSRG